MRHLPLELASLSTDAVDGLAHDDYVRAKPAGAFLPKGKTDMRFILSHPTRNASSSSASSTEGRRRGRASPELRTARDRPQRGVRSDGDADALSLYRADVGAETLLTAEEEGEIARAITMAERALLDALVDSPAGRAELVAVGRDLEQHDIDIRTVVLNPDEQGLDLKAVDERVRVVLGGVATCDEDERTSVADALAEVRLSRAVLERVIAAVRDGDDARAFHAIARAKRDLQRAKDRLVVGNLRLVLLFARRYQHQGIPFLDLVQEGNVGLMRAADKFDFRRGFRFNTYASFWIKQALQRALVHRTFRIPVHVASDRHRISRTRAKFVALNEREPTAAEIASLTGLSNERVQSILDFPKQPASLDAPIGEDGDARLADMIPAETPSAEEIVAASALGDRLHELLADLSERERRVVRMRFGIGPEREHSLEEVGRELSLTRERIRQIERGALKKLRARSKGRDLESFLRP